MYPPFLKNGLVSSSFSNKKSSLETEKNKSEWRIFKSVVEKRDIESRV